MKKYGKKNSARDWPRVLRIDANRPVLFNPSFRRSVSAGVALVPHFTVQRVMALLVMAALDGSLCEALSVGA